MHDPTVRWGDTRRLTFDANATTQVAEFQRVDLPRPLVCRLSLHIEARAQGATPLFAQVNFTAIEYVVGVGSSMATVRRVFQSQPQVGVGGPGQPVIPGFSQPAGTPFDSVWELPIQHLHGRVEGSGNMCHLIFTLGLAPIDGIGAFEDLSRPEAGAAMGWR